ncbi:MAG: hypothetical protein NTW85_14725 [Methylococcales bacterium]|nr:hypothetical protein [Methylococcales bacterium]
MIPYTLRTQAKQLQQQAAAELAHAKQQVENRERLKPLVLV